MLSNQFGQERLRSSSHLNHLLSNHLGTPRICQNPVVEWAGLMENDPLCIQVSSLKGIFSESLESKRAPDQVTDIGIGTASQFQKGKQPFR
jgi:hypothetical protein